MEEFFSFVSFLFITGCIISTRNCDIPCVGVPKVDTIVWEALEIQYHECGPKKGGMNLDDGHYNNNNNNNQGITILRL